MSQLPRDMETCFPAARRVSAIAHLPPSMLRRISRSTYRLEKLANVTSLWQSDRARPFIAINFDAHKHYRFSDLQLESPWKYRDHRLDRLFWGDARIALFMYNGIYTISPLTRLVIIINCCVSVLGRYPLKCRVSFYWTEPASVAIRI